MTTPSLPPSRDGSQVWRAFAGIALCAITAAAIGVLFPSTWSASFVRHGGVPMMAAIVIWFAVSLAVVLGRADIRAFLSVRRREVAIASLVIAAGTAWVHVREPHGFKVVADEPLLMATSAQMHLEHTAGTLLRGQWIDDRFVVLNDMLDKRPLLYPFLVSLLHALTGFRAENGIVLNAILTPVFLALVFALVRQLATVPIAVAGIALVLSAGVVPQNMTSSGFDLLNATLFACLGVVLAVFVRRRDGWLCSLFLAVLAMLVNTRYEGAVLALPALGAFLWACGRSPELLRQRSLHLAPFAVIPLLLVFRVFKERPAVWQLAELGDVETPFSPAFIGKNVGHGVSFLFAADGRFGNSPLLAVLGLIAGVFTVVRLPRLVLRYWREPQPSDALVLWAVGGFVHCLLLMSYVWARLDDLLATRLAIPLLLVFTVLGAALLQEVADRFGGRTSARAAAALAIVYAILFYGTAATHGLYLQRNPAAVTANWVNALAKRIDNKNTLVIDDAYRHVWAINRVGTTLPRILADRPEQFRFLIEKDVYAAVLLVQSFVASDADGSLKTTPWHDFSAWATLEPVEELRLAPGVTTRVVRLVSVDWEQFNAWVERMKTIPTDGTMPAEPIHEFNVRVIQNLL